ncbi:MAG: hypothetical protein DM484_02775 [Candidatus Methylumidiphilus alinenensis]|uniref:Uncharacterized protein n=1 Tax=Candidatus Methylumidiphilus alinenensis TaxID=2202197 RepID=A0A2W4RL65_9GAMM|nr:MAG: hypothetical protein DM484_02775 [Candidatus Methylumidiphilus alinenensis]
MPKARLFGMDADKFVGNEFGRAERGAKPEPHGCGEPIQAMDGNQLPLVARSQAPAWEWGF